MILYKKIRMNIHKFNVKPKHKPHKTIKCIIPLDVKYPAKKVNSITWEILVKKILNFNLKKLNN